MGGVQIATSCILGIMTAIMLGAMMGGNDSLVVRWGYQAGMVIVKIGSMALVAWLVAYLAPRRAVWVIVTLSIIEQIFYSVLSLWNTSLTKGAIHLLVNNEVGLLTVMVTEIALAFFFIHHRSKMRGLLLVK